MDLLEGKLLLHGVQYTTNKHQIADLQDIKLQICWIADGMLKGIVDWVLQSPSSQPGGPCQAGAGGFHMVLAFGS